MRNLSDDLLKAKASAMLAVARHRIAEALDTVRENRLEERVLVGVLGLPPQPDEVGVDPEVERLARVAHDTTDCVNGWYEMLPDYRDHMRAAVAAIIAAQKERPF